MESRAMAHGRGKEPGLGINYDDMSDTEYEDARARHLASLELDDDADNNDGGDEEPTGPDNSGDEWDGDAKRDKAAVWEFVKKERIVVSGLLTNNYKQSCLQCGITWKGSATRAKLHIVGKPWCRDVKPCPNPPKAYRAYLQGIFRAKDLQRRGQADHMELVTKRRAATQLGWPRGGQRL
eukprot:jgi/Mesvir1/4004/Mv04462-RA.1